PVFAEIGIHLHDPQLVRERRRREQQRGDYSSNVSEAHQLSQSTPESGGADCMCTALISQKPPCGMRSDTRPRASVRARTALSGSDLLRATTSTFAAGLPRNSSVSGNSSPTRGSLRGTSSKVKPSGASIVPLFALPALSNAFAQR